MSELVAEFGGRCRQCRNQLRQKLEESTNCSQCHNQLWQSLEEGPGTRGLERGTNVDSEALEEKKIEKKKKHHSFALQHPGFRTIATVFTMSQISHSIYNVTDSHTVT